MLATLQSFIFNHSNISIVIFNVQMYMWDVDQLED